MTATLLLLAARQWPLDHASLALAVGFSVMAFADGLYAIGVADGTYVDGTIVEALWPVATMAIAVAAWIRVDPAREAVAGDRRLPPTFVAGAVILAIAILILDQFAPLDDVTLLLAVLTLLAAVAELLFLGRDRTRSKSTALELEALRSASTQAALDCIVSMDADGHVCEWNDAARRTFGYDREDALGRELAELIIPPEYRARHRTGLARAVATGQGPILGKRIEVMAMHAEGSQFPVELAVTQVRDEPPMFTGLPARYQRAQAAPG